MRAKSMLLLIIALGCGVVASVAVSQVVMDQKRGEVQSVPVLIAKKEISAATKIPADSFQIEQWPIDRVPIGAISDPKLIENKFTKQRIYPGEPLIEAKLSGKGRDFTVPEGYRTFDIGVKDETGGGGYIGPGDHVDVYGYFDKGPRVKSATSVRVMENLEVVMIDGVAVIDQEATKQKKSSTIQLLVKDSQYIVLDTASNLGKLRLALRPPTKETSSAVQDDGEKFTSWLKDSEAKQEERAIVETANTPASVDRPEKHDMVIVTPTKSTMYRFNEGQAQPQKIDMDQPDEGAVPGGYQSQSQSTQYKLGKTSGTGQTSNSTQSSSNTLGGQKTAPVNPSGAAQPNLTWDPSSGNWQSGGFKATYPNSN